MRDRKTTEFYCAGCDQFFPDETELITHLFLDDKQDRLLHEKSSIADDKRTRRSQ